MTIHVGLGSVSVRPLDPRDGNEWTELGTVVTVEGPCHFLDALGRPLCGRSLIGNRSPHPIGTCCDEGHSRCSACDQLMMIDGDGDGLQEAA